MNISNLKNILKTEPKYRLKQAKQAIFLDLIENWDDNSTLPKQLREILKQECPLEINAGVFISKNKKVIKAVITLEDKNKIETVLMKHQGNHNTVCVSTQVGCALGCKFCATGQMGFMRNLTVSEILEQVIFFARYLKRNKNRISNIVFMGMGEPFLNYDNTMSAIRRLNSKEDFNIGARKISISTSGIIDGIKKIADENLQINLAISLHAPNDKLRNKIMPINKKYAIDKILSAVDQYILKTNRKVMFEYLLIKNVNDSRQCAEQLAIIMKKPLYMVNLIRCNYTDTTFQPSSKLALEKFKKILERKGINTTERREFGQDIKAACGQLAGK
ncbi:MAG: 23S rRNA (adenine(2503)-C(2))-methyltransferase RlmN [Candidatus Kuenenbacteria bacterium]